MTDMKTSKVEKEEKTENKNPPRRSFDSRSLGILHIDSEALDLKNRAYRWAIQNDKHGRDDYNICYEMGYRETAQGSLKKPVRSDSSEKVIRQSHGGTYILMDAPIEYRNQTNDEMAQFNKSKLEQMGLNRASPRGISLGNADYIEN